MHTKEILFFENWFNNVLLLLISGEKPFECDECEQTFRQKQLLKRHKNLYHTPDYSKPEPKEKNYDCTLCNKQFANKGNFLRHMQNHDPEYWNKKLSEGENPSMSTDELIQGSLLSDMREGKLGIAPKVVIVHPNGSVEEVTSRLQNLVAEKQMEEMMVQVVQEGNNQSTSLEDAIRSQVEVAIRNQVIIYNSFNECDISRHHDLSTQENAVFTKK